jgi:hypothetical protein
MLSDNNENININIDENDFKNNDVNDDAEFELLLKEIDNTPLNDFFLNESDYFNIETQRLIYEMQYTIKDLIKICDYYGISKDIRTNKLKKEDIIYFLLDFEGNILNREIVCKRKQMWYFIDELKNDKFMKKFIIW